MSKRGVIQCILAILLAAYLAVGLVYANMQASYQPYKRLDIRVAATDTVGFVTADDINQALGNLRDTIGKMHACDVNTYGIEQAVMALDNIESANCVVLNNRAVRLDVTPLIPVARVFDTSTGQNFYINRQGKKMLANAQFRMDVPVVVGDFSWRASHTDVIPVIDYLQQHPDMGSLVSSIYVAKKGDIYLVPMIRGHVVNFGDNQDIENKFDRLRVFYKKVLPVKGWEYYDNISVKWKGQIVANRHAKELPAINIPQEDESDIDDLETVSTPEETNSANP